MLQIVSYHCRPVLHTLDMPCQVPAIIPSLLILPLNTCTDKRRKEETLSGSKGCLQLIMEGDQRGSLVAIHLHLVLLLLIRKRITYV